MTITNTPPAFKPVRTRLTEQIKAVRGLTAGQWFDTGLANTNEGETKANGNAVKVKGWVARANAADSLNRVVRIAEDTGNIWVGVVKDDDTEVESGEDFDPTLDDED